MYTKESVNRFLFSLAIGLISYGFALSNYSLSVDSESIIYPDFSLDLGRWGNNLIRYHLFKGHLPYFTMLLGIILMSLSALELTRLFRFKSLSAYAFCALFMSFPQMAYNLIFTMQADTVPLGLLCGILSYSVFETSFGKFFSLKGFLKLLGAATLLMFSLSMYQALLFVPVVIYIIRALQHSYSDEFELKSEVISGIHFAAFVLLGGLLYWVSVKLICPPIEGGYLSSYTSGPSGNLLANFANYWATSVMGNQYYGAKIYLAVPIFGLFLLYRFVREKRFSFLRISIFLVLLVVPFLIGFFITNQYYPPRILVSTPILLAFVVVFAFEKIDFPKPALIIVALMCLINVYFITALFNSNYKIFNYDKDTARKIDMVLRTEYPDFDENVNYVYFQGCLPYERYDKIRLPKSEIFGGSLFNWDNGSNPRIINFFRFSDIGYYKMIDNKEVYLKIKDSIEPMPVWPKKGSVKMIQDVMVVKLGKEKGANLWVE